MHKLLARQLRRCGVEPTAELENFLDAIDEAYRSADDDRLMMERSMELASREIMEQNEELARQVEEKTVALESLRSSEAALIEAVERLKKMDKTRADFINAAAHELGTPLTPLKLQVYLVRNAKGQSHDKSVDILERNVDRLSHLVRDLLDSSKLQTGNLELDEELVDLGALAAGAVASFMPVADQVGVKLNLERGEFLEAKCDVMRISQVFDNLLSNALKFTSEGNSVTVRASKTMDQALISVQDDGTGIALEDQEKLFQPFSQVGNDASTARAGTGLGLHICKGIVERSGGKIWVESAGLGAGSTFNVQLPLSKEAD